MCHDPVDRPPAPPRVGPIAESQQITLTSSDGTLVSAAVSLPVEQASAAIVVLPDVRGLHGYYIALADRLAEAGLAAIAIDYFGRTAGLAPTGGRPTDFDFRPEIEQTTAAAIDADTSAAITHIRKLTSPTTPVFVLGFCFGGSNAWRQAATALDLAGCMGFYGRPDPVGDAADHIAKPTLMLIAGNDSATSVEDSLKLAERMRGNGAEIIDVVFDGAPHSFFDRAFDDWSAACDEAWRQILTFVDRLATP